MKQLERASWLVGAVRDWLVLGPRAEFNPTAPYHPAPPAEKGFAGAKHALRLHAMAALVDALDLTAHPLGSRASAAEPCEKKREVARKVLEHLDANPLLREERLALYDRFARFLLCVPLDAEPFLRDAGIIMSRTLDEERVLTVRETLAKQARRHGVPSLNEPELVLRGVLKALGLNDRRARGLFDFEDQRAVRRRS